MNLIDVLINWMLYSLYRLWYLVIANAGLSNPVALAFIAIYNVISTGYLWLLTAIGYLAWRRRGWILPFTISLVWTFIVLLFFEACWQRYGLTTALATIFTHGWLELAAVFYWIHNLRKACLNCHVSFENDWSSWRDLLFSLWEPIKLFHIVGGDMRKAWKRVTRVLTTLWSRGLRRAFLLVLILIFVSALIETYITPIVVSSLLVKAFS